jgi:predicted metal-binding protein
MKEREIIKIVKKIGSKFGLVDAKIILPQNIVIANWTRLKCKYGCSEYGRRWTCPPGSPTPEKTRKIVSQFERAILLKFEKHEGTQKAVSEIEKELFLKGFYKAFGLAAGPCEFCRVCAYPKPCRHPEMARPSMEACGIDVYATARRTGFSINVIKNYHEVPKYFGLILIE